MKYYFLLLLFYKCRVHVAHLSGLLFGRQSSIARHLLQTIIVGKERVLHDTNGVARHRDIILIVHQVVRQVIRSTVRNEVCIILSTAICRTLEKDEYIGTGILTLSLEI